MARKNITGISFCGLELEKGEEKFWKDFLKKKDISAKQHLRYLVRKFIREGGGETDNHSYLKPKS